MPPRPYQPGECLRIRDERWRVVRTNIVDEQTIVDVIGCDLLNAGAHALFLGGAEQVERLPANASPRLVRPARWRTIARHRLSAATPRFAALRTAAAADVTIMPFQLEPALALTHGLGRRLLIADEVGLGKTVQAGLVIAETLARASEGHALVVAPAALRQQWVEELQQRFRLPAVVLDAPTIARAVTALGTGANPWAAYPVVVVSIDYIKRAEVMRALEALVWDVVVFDEAHVLAGLSERAAAAQQLGARARALVSLTATPHSGDQDAFDRLADLGRLGNSAPLLLFRRSRRDVGLPSTRRSRWFAVRSTKAELDMHGALLNYARTVCRQRPTGTSARLAMSILLKRGCSSAASLARSLERRLTLIAATSTPQDANQLQLPFDSGDDQEPMAVLGAPGLTDRSAEEEMLSFLLAAARTASGDERKINALRRLLRRCAEPAIVFTEYRDTLEHIARQLTGHCIAIVHGGLTLSERRVALDQFTHRSADVLLATDAASEGLNLHHRCRRVVNMELPWTPVRLEQRIGRVDRIGQRQIVHATHLIARDTVENDIVARLLARLTTADTSLAGVAAQEHEDRIVAAVTASPREGAALARQRSVRDTPAIVVPDLRVAAQEEAAQLMMSRGLATPGHDSVDGRPVITRIRHGGPARCVWAMRLFFADGSAHVCWSTLVGVTAHQQPRISDLRRTLDGQLGADLLHEHLRAVTTALIGGAVLFASSAIAREDEILTSLHATRARLVPRERGLFDRRDERASAAQIAVLAEAVSRCERQRRQLASLERLTLNSCELAFAVAIE